MIWLKRVLVVSAVGLSLFGAYLSTQMLLQHLFGKSTSTLLTAMCDATGGGCDKIASSRWSTIPPKPKSPEQTAAVPGKNGGSAAQKHAGVHVPVPILGLLYFSFLAAWFLGVGCPNQLGRRWQLVPFIGVLVGNGWSVFFIYVMAQVVKAWCAGCLMIHGINLLLLIIVFVTCPRQRRKHAIRSTIADHASPPAVPAIPHPTARLALVTLALAMSFGLIGGAIAVAVVFALEVARNKPIVEEVIGDPEILARMYSKRDRIEIPITPDAPSFGGEAGAPLTMIVFSDMTCSRCKQFEELLTETIVPGSANRLRVVFKHFPLSDACNHYARGRGSTHSCEAARAAEAARLQGGNELFWKMLGRVRAQSEDLASLDYRAEAVRLGLDGDRFVEDMQSERVRNRISEDVELGHKLAVEATPTVFLNDRIVPTVAQDKPAFWKLMYKRLAEDPAAVEPLAPSTAPSLTKAESSAGLPR